MSPDFTLRARPSKMAKRNSDADRWLFGLDVLLALVLGATHSLPMSFPHAWWLQIVCVAGLAYRVRRATPWRAAVIGQLFGTAWLCAGVWWLFISMHRYGGLSAAVSVAAILALCSFLSLYLAAAMALFARMRRNRALLDAFLFGACWLLAELARGVIFTGFPWAASGYAHVEGPLSHLAPFMGAYGLGFVSAVLGSLMVMGLNSRGHALAGAMISTMTVGAILLGLGLVKIPLYTRPTAQLQLSLLQSNVPQSQKFSAEFMPQALEWTAANMLAAKGDLVIAPETVVPLLPSQVPDSYWQPLLKRFHAGPQAALFGMPQGDAQVGYTNSAVGISAGTVKAAQGLYRYDKQHLVPFGEFIPPGFRWFTNLMHIPLGDFNRGVRVAPSFVVQGERIAPTICYEDLFGEEIAARFADAVTAPTVLANLTNIGWFGDTIALNQHLQISRMRSLEFQLPMVRATNTGTTAVIDAHGQVTHALPPHTRGVLEAPVQGRVGLTPFAMWASRFGLLPLLILVALPILWALPLRRRPD